MTRSQPHDVAEPAAADGTRPRLTAPTPHQIAASIPLSRAPVVLDPDHAGGWFGGTSVVAWDPALRASGLTLADAADCLDKAYSGDGYSLCVVIADYDGSCAVLGYEGYMSRRHKQWESHGDIDETPLAEALRLEAVPLDANESLMGAAVSEMDSRGYVAAVHSIQESIRAGNVYLVNMTYRVRGFRVLEPGAAYSTLVSRASSMMNAFVSDGTRSLASVSPERFLSMSTSSGAGIGNDAQIWPIKGTRPRAECPDCDMRLAEELRASTKERAEHVMVVDLERNDLGRVSRTGSVYVDPLMDVAQTPYCHQMYSAIHSTIDGEQPVARLLEAAFPCGSVTGTPKIAAMKRIAELELSPRGAYTGSLIAATRGQLDGSVLIRTLVDDGADVEWGTGGGITIDSDPFEEWLETRLKAEPVLGPG